ncbi:7767_t:CDS:2, partial [Cetraspora pellucida]
MYDLPVSPAFSIFTAFLQDPVTIDNDDAFFYLKRDSYDGVILSKITMSVLYKYNPRGHHSNVADNLRRFPIVLVTGELVMLKRLVCILSNIIEWTYPNQLAKKFEVPNVRYYKGKEKMATNAQEESSLRVKRLKNNIENVK